MPYATTPSLGSDFNLVGEGHWEAEPSAVNPELGTVYKGNDGRDYIKVVSGDSQISANAAVVIDDVTFEATAGAGNFRPPADQVIPANTVFWARQIAIPGTDA